ncbi:MULTISPECIES: PepSY domain-containing protein [Prauserella salsuginis group]|uniref:PepSY domain-containing protein n=2 Tax=Prauserella salsuginis group TaxID=2893672 RepID=A0ABW6G076_9PSEU|nr:MULTISPECIES: PepSY domain-containing protein [Prauserella salsuginis group]MBB3663054.1 putative membrane protein YkoI [Prauserella sediminis]MCR3721217.1 Peptidase propeptide and YPEB domain-containing protein [Prauserella flava]MCR3734702.1 Peptidase propeptide and YPEB domain-containing protein [Prauserella salsuginis]
MLGKKKLVGAIAVAGGVLAMSGTAVAFAADGGQSGDSRPASAQQQSERPYTGPDPEDIYTGPGDHYTGPGDHYTGPDSDDIHTGPKGEQAPSHWGNPWPEHCSSEQPAVGAQQAERIALQRVPGASVIEIDLDRCYGLEWEVDLRKGAAEYEIEIDADNGKIVSFEQDRDD